MERRPSEAVQDPELGSSGRKELTGHVDVQRYVECDARNLSEGFCARGRRS